MSKAKKELGQHWLQDTKILEQIAQKVNISAGDFVVEVGPGLGTLTSKLLKHGANVLAVEFDEQLAANLPKSFPNKKELEVRHQNILDFNFEELDVGYKVAANLPYYISGAFFRLLMQVQNKPVRAVVLIQKEVAERIATSPEGRGSNKLAMLVNYFYQTELDIIVGPESFNPPPKVKSQVLILTKRNKPLFNGIEFKEYAKFVKIAFASPRKTLVNNLSVGLQLAKDDIVAILKSLKLSVDSPDIRAEQMILSDWQSLLEALQNIKRSV